MKAAATQQVIDNLTAIHGEEVESTIRHFELNWHSLEAHFTPTLQSELAIDPYLGYYGYEKTDLDQEPFWYLTNIVVVENVEVFSYSPQKFKATACFTDTGTQVTTETKFMARSQIYICGVYVFVRENPTEDWKLAGFFNTADKRDWDYLPTWLKEIIGDYPR